MTAEQFETDSRHDPRLQVRGISKRYSGVVALDRVSFCLMPGETLALIGENGAGKSTLMKVLAGIVSPNAGTLTFNGRPCHFRSPGDAIANGISLIHQELNLHENLTIAENVFLGREPSVCGIVNFSAMNRLSAEYLARVGLDLPPTTELSRLSTAERQLVEVAKALSTNASVVIMDEPTSSLSVRETDRLFEVVRSLRNDSVSTIYISHRLGEVIELADRVEVLRDGRNAGQLVGDQINYDAMVAAMVGRDVSQLFDREPFKPGAKVLQVENLNVETEACPAIDLHVNSGEVVGVAGLVGSGRSELLETIFGIRKPARGRIRINNVHVPLGSTVAAIDAGMALVPEDRKRTGLFTQYSVAENAVVSAITDAPVAPMISRRWIAKVAGDLIKQLGVKTSSQNTTIDHLSGGNQQKIALGKWLIDPPKLLMLDEPTRGVDVGAKQEIYELLHQLAGEGMAILFVSSEMDEVISLADRVLVMHDGAISGTLRRDELSEQAIMRLAVGLPPNESSGQTDKKPSSPA